MATKKRKSTKRRTAARRKKAEQRLPAGLGTLFGGLLLMVLAFVQGDSAWRVLHDVLFGLFGCGSFVLGAAVCCLAVLYTRGEELLSRILKLVLGLIFVCGTVIVFSDIQPQGLSALQMLSACYANGVNAWLSGGAMGFVLGGMMSIDFGGPLNKAAYVFGTASLAAADGSAVSSEIMAAVMIGGMVPPVAIALSTLLFSDKFTAKERQSGLTNFIMGLSFITEGAIPFAASDPLRVIPTCALGSAMAGALSMAFGCSVPAPHGGVFVFGVVQNWPMYFVALAAGSVVAAVLMGFVKKSVNE